MTRKEFDDKWKNTSVFIWAKKDEFLYDYESVIKNEVIREELIKYEKITSGASFAEVETYVDEYLKSQQK